MSEVLVDPDFMSFLNISGFGPDDVEMLKRIGPNMIPLLAELTDVFYERLALEPVTAALIEGRVDVLKSTHIAWFKDLFNIDNIENFIKRQEHIGQVHVRAGVAPTLVAGSMGWLRSVFPRAAATAFTEPQEVADAIRSVNRALDVCQFLINRSYTNVVDTSKKSHLMGNLGISDKLLAKLMSTD